MVSIPSNAPRPGELVCHNAGCSRPREAPGAIHMTTRSIWIELDSLHSSVLLRAINEGLMPNLARIRERGTATRVEYEIPLQVAAWATAHTGLSVAEHGAIAYDQPIPDTYRMRIEPRPAPPDAAYWNALGKMGKRVLVINSVNSILTPEVNGIQLNEWSTHVAGRHAKPTSFPPNIAASLEREFRGDPFAKEDCGSKKFVDAERLVNAISSNLLRKATAFSKLIDREGWDHVHIGIDDLHNLGHVLWDAFEANNPRNCLVRKALNETDAMVGTLLDRAGPGAAAMVLVLGEIGPANTWSHMVDKIIARFERGESRNRNIYGVLGRIWSAQPPWLTSSILPLKSYLREFYLGAIRRRRRAYAMPLNEESGAIRINLRGREPNGLVDPGKEYNSLVGELREGFLDLRDTKSGIPLVSEFLLTRDIVPEAMGHPRMPDIFVKWNRAKRMDAVYSDRLGRIEMDFWPARTGDHHVDGFVLLDQPIVGDRKVSVLDLAPTIAALHSLGRPKGWRGSALIESTSVPRMSRQPPEHLFCLSVSLIA